jgi:peptide/nickel transport system permease protein
MRHPVTIICLAICAAFIAIAALGPLILPQDPLAQSFIARLKPPSAEHWFGTDRYGRDVFARVLLGTRWSLLLGLAAPLIAGVFGTVIGALAGFYGGWFDRIAGRVADLLMAFPSLLLGILLAAALGPGFGNLIAAVAFAFLPRFIRVARAATLSVREQLYVEAAFAVGERPWRIVLRHVLPNISGPMIVVGTLWIATAIRIEATLSFIGLGVQPPQPSWGNIIRDGLTNILGSPWPIVTTGLTLTLCVLAFNIVGDALRDAIDPDYRE